jgi:hypothetical protein
LLPQPSSADKPRSRVFRGAGANHGENFERAGFDHIEGIVVAMVSGEDTQLSAMLAFSRLIAGIQSLRIRLRANSVVYTILVKKRLYICCLHQRMGRSAFLA